MNSHSPGSIRHEIKMTCSESYLPDVRSWIQLHPEGFVEAYPPRQVNNLYLDTREADCLNSNLIGVANRAKLRFRWYGQDDLAVRGVLELKCKSNQLRWKRHCPIPSTFDLTTIYWNDWIGQMRNHAYGIVGIWLSYLDRPTLLNRYMREYYESTDRQVRATVDYDQRVYDQIGQPVPNLSFRTPVEKRVVIELKFDPALYRRVSNILSLLPFRVERNSKYVNGVTSSLHF